MLSDKYAFIYRLRQLFLVPLRGKHVVLSIGKANSSLALPRDAHTAPLGAGSINTKQRNARKVGAIYCRVPQRGRRREAAGGATYTKGAPLAAIYAKGPLRGNPRVAIAQYIPKGPQYMPKGPFGAILAIYA